MSVVTDMVIFCALGEDEVVGAVNAWCAEHDAARGQVFAKLDETAAGGDKVFTGSVWAMAGNFFPWQELAQAFPRFGWRYPAEAVLVINHENEERVHVYRATAS